MDQFQDNFDMLKDLLLNSYDNNMFLGYNIKIKIFGLMPIYSLVFYDDLENSDLFKGVDKIYIIHNFNDYELKKINLPKYLEKRGSIPLEYIKCDLNNFATKFPEFINDKISNDIDYLDLVYSFEKSKNKIFNESFIVEELGGTLVLPNLIIGQSFDFYYKNDNIESSIKKIVNKNITAIINVGNECSKDYSNKIIKMLFKNNILIFDYGLSEINDNDNNNYQNILNCAEKINELINKGHKVYIHCYMGKNRSVSAVLLYMVKYLSLPLKIAIELIGLKKSISPQIQFASIIYDEALKNESKPLALHKFCINCRNIGNTYSSYALGIIDLYYLDVIANRKPNPLPNNYYDNFIKEKISNNINEENYNSCLIS